VSLRNLFILVLSLLAFGTLEVPSASAKARKVVAYSGKISAVKNGRDRKKKRYWEYKLRTAKGETIIVHDYQYGRYRQPASMGIREGAKRSVRGFFVHISTKLGSTKKVPVLIVSPAN
jgi:hypothetical protein